MDAGIGKSLESTILAAGISSRPEAQHFQDILEIISSTERLSDAGDVMGNIAFGGPDLPDGGRWYPNIDFDSHVVAWIHLGSATLTAAQISNIRAEETDTTVSIEITVGSTDCHALASTGAGYVFVELPKLDKPYQLVVHQLQPNSCT
jgi:hypothetical protein